MYMIRDENGILLMKVKNDIAVRIIVGTSGEFKPYKYPNPHKPTADTEVICYQITDDCSMETDCGKFYLWAGTKLIPEAKVPTVGIKGHIKNFFGVEE